MRLDRGCLKLLLGENAMELRDLHWFCSTTGGIASQPFLNQSTILTSESAFYRIWDCRDQALLFGGLYWGLPDPTVEECCLKWPKWPLLAHRLVYLFV